VDEAGFNIPKKRNYARIKHSLCKRIPVERVTGDKGVFNEPGAYGKLG
jgi:hypothetical protein